MKHTLVIAEAGVNHNGDIRLALELVDAAVYSGADIVKFQTFRARKIATNLAPKAEYQKHSTERVESQLVMLEKLEINPEQHQKLIDYCQQCGIEFLSTAFDLQSINLLSSLSPQRWKVPSGEITNFPYLKRIGQKKQPVIISTGMANLGEIEAAIDVLEFAGTSRNQITVLHCTTEYPAPLNEVNLHAMQSIGHAFGVEVGYSDHTDGIVVPIGAVALGATVIEKHLTTNRTLDGPDHRASLEPGQFAAMVQGIRSIEKALGDGIKRPTDSEQANLSIVRKSLVAARTIKEGELFTAENITTKRPGTGISPMNWNIIIGSRASKDYLIDEMISW